MRAETAAITFAALLQHRFGDLPLDLVLDLFRTIISVTALRQLGLVRQRLQDRIQQSLVLELEIQDASPSQRPGRQSALSGTTFLPDQTAKHCPKRNVTDDVSGV